MNRTNNGSRFFPKSIPKKKAFTKYSNCLLKTPVFKITPPLPDGVFHGESAFPRECMEYSDVDLKQYKGSTAQIVNTLRSHLLKLINIARTNKKDVVITRVHYQVIRIMCGSNWCTSTLFIIL